MDKVELHNWTIRTAWIGMLAGAIYSFIHSLFPEHSLFYLITVILAGRWIIDWIVDRRLRRKKKDLFGN